VAFGVNDPTIGTEALVLLAEVQPRSVDELQELVEGVRATVSDQIGLSPAEVYLLKPGSLARTSSGKLMRRDARDRYLRGALESAESVRAMLPVRLVEAALKLLARFLARRRASQG
jgi:acyl-CoA synthetase (AMP-forming)/AMP-acid ligase II